MLNLIKAHNFAIDSVLAMGDSCDKVQYVFGILNDLWALLLNVVTFGLLLLDHRAKFVNQIVLLAIEGEQ